MQTFQVGLADFLPLIHCAHPPAQLGLIFRIILAVQVGDQSRKFQRSSTFNFAIRLFNSAMLTEQE
jgi:hypothetical protein